MAWIKRGLIFTPNNEREWSRSHSQIPTIDMVGQQTLRIYYSTRNADNRSHISYFEVSAADPGQILYQHEQPILAPGELGTFDDCGVMPSSIVTVGEKKYLYYIGWNVRNTVPYHNSIGLAVSEDCGRTFERFSQGPIFERTPQEPFFTGTSWVMLDDGIWKNWYMSCTEWNLVHGTPEPRYHLKYAESLDGIDWKRAGTVAIEYQDDHEGGIARASVVRELQGYKMWYSYRKQIGYRSDSEASYRIGYATSADGVAWQRRDEEFNLGISDTGWDSFMLAYPCVIDSGGRRFLFYNGNGFGQSGIGYAEFIYE